MASIRKRNWTYKGEGKSAWVVDYTDQTGKRRHKTFERKKNADAFLVKARHEVSQGTHTPEHASITVADAAELWIKGKELEGLERSTIAQYRQHVDLHINPIIGDVKLARLTTPGMQAVRDQLLGTRSRAMARAVFRSIHGLLSDAQRRGLVAQNVATGVTIRTDRRNEQPVVIPTKDEIGAMLNAVQGRWRPLVVTAILTGMRASELRGLTWNDVDFDEGVIRVTQRADKWNQIGPPKSKAGRREIPLTPMVEHTLRPWRLQCPGGDLNLVFPNTVGKVERLSTISRRCFGPLQIACGIVRDDGKPKYGLHALRHFYASWLIDQDFSPKRVQTVLGHASITMTFDTYGHLFPSPDDRKKLAAGELALVG